MSGSISGSRALTGDDWRSQLVYTHYEGEDESSLTSSTTWYHQHHLQNLPNGLTPPEAASDATAGNVTTISAYAIDLGGSKFCTTFQRMMTHHIIKVETDNNYLFTFEKNKEDVVVQSCKLLEAHVPPPVLNFTHGIKRKRRRTRKEIAKDVKPTKCSIGDVIKWICESGQLKLTYHIAEANCQHFANSLWNQFASVPFPIPAEYGMYNVQSCS